MLYIFTGHELTLLNQRYNFRTYLFSLQLVMCVWLFKTYLFVLQLGLCRVTAVKIPSTHHHSINYIFSIKPSLLFYFFGVFLVLRGSVYSIYRI